MLGLACGTKWSGIYFVVAFTLLSLAFDVAARRAYRVQRPWLGVLRRDVVPSSLSLAVMPALIYLATFAPWFASETAVYRYQVSAGDPGPPGWLPAAWRSLWYYQSGILKFHEGLTSSAGNHHPWSRSRGRGRWACGQCSTQSRRARTGAAAAVCMRVQMLIGTPAIWWLALPVLAWSLWAFLGRRDWRYGAVLVGYAAAFAPWFANIDRQMYFFYATVMAPFLVILVALCLGDILRHAAGLPSAATAHRRTARSFSSASSRSTWRWWSSTSRGCGRCWPAYPSPSCTGTRRSGCPAGRSGSSRSRTAAQARTIMTGASACCSTFWLVEPSSMP